MLKILCFWETRDVLLQKISIVVVKRLRLTQISSGPLQSGITAFYAENLMFLGDKRRFASKNINFSRMRVDLATPSS